jgi:hypothetical protein
MIKNANPHTIAIVDGNGTVVRTFEKSDTLIRVAVKTTVVGSLEDIPVSTTEYGTIMMSTDDGKTFVPFVPEMDTTYIVSGLVLSANARLGENAWRCFVAPDSGSSVRNAEGQIVGVKGFVI